MRFRTRLLVLAVLLLGLSVVGTALGAAILGQLHDAGVLDRGLVELTIAFFVLAAAIVQYALVTWLGAEHAWIATPAGGKQRTWRGQRVIGVFGLGLLLVNASYYSALQGDAREILLLTVTTFAALYVIYIFSPEINRLANSALNRAAGRDAEGSG